MSLKTEMSEINARHLSYLFPGSKNKIFILSFLQICHISKLKCPWDSLKFLLRFSMVWETSLSSWTGQRSLMRQFPGRWPIIPSYTEEAPDPALVPTTTQLRVHKAVLVNLSLLGQGRAGPDYREMRWWDEMKDERDRQTHWVEKHP